MTDGKIELFWISGSPYAWRVMLALEAKGIPYEAELLEFSRGELRAAEFLALNPRGKVPVLRHGDVVLYESLAILAYLDRAFPARPLLGTTPVETGLIWRHLSEFTSYVIEPFSPVGGALVFGFKDEDIPRIRAAVARLHEELARLEGATSTGGHLVGDALTAADIGVYPFLKGWLRAVGKPAAHALDLGLFPLASRYPRLARLMDRIEALDGYARTYPPHWRAADAVKAAAE